MVAWLLVLHIFGLTLWISGLVATSIGLVQFAKESSAEGRQALARGQRIALRALADPGALLTVLAGTMLVVSNSSYYLNARWLHIKLAFVAILIVLHVLIAMRGKAAAAGRGATDSGQAKMLLILVVLVFLSILIATLPGEVFLR